MNKFLFAWDRVRLPMLIGFSVGLLVDSILVPQTWGYYTICVIVTLLIVGNLITMWLRR